MKLYDCSNQYIALLINIELELDAFQLNESHSIVFHTIIPCLCVRLFRLGQYTISLLRLIIKVRNVMLG